MADDIWINKLSLAHYLEEVARTVSEDPPGPDGKKRYNYRNVWNIDRLNATRDYIKGELESMGYNVKQTDFIAKFGFSDESELHEETVSNLVVDIPGSEFPDEIVLIGAHYDSRASMQGDGDLERQRGRIPKRPENNNPTKDSDWNTPGANDNGSGIATLLALAKEFKDKKITRTLRLVAWVNEEFPFYSNAFLPEKKGKDGYISEGMGSYVHAKSCAGKDGSGVRENIVCAISFDTMGWYPGDAYKYKGRGWLDRFMIWIQHFPPVGDYVAFLSNNKTGKILKKFERHYNSKKPGVRAIKRFVPMLLDRTLNKKGAWSDDWSYWQFDYPGFIVTDLAYIRSPRYHRNDDIVEHIDFPLFTEVVWQLRETIEAFANREF